MRRAHRVLPPLFAAALLAVTLAGAPSVKAEENLQSLQTRLQPEGLTPGAWGRVKYKLTHGYRRLTIETHGLAPGFYDILVGAGVVGSMEVVDGISSGEGSGVFVLDSRSAGLLIFDPRGTSVEVVSQTNGMTELSISDFPANKREETRKANIKVDFKSADVQPAASGGTEFRSSKGRSRFVVRIAGLEPGTYDLLIGGTSQGRIRIMSLDEVELSFDTMPQDEQGGDDPLIGDDPYGGLNLLTFDPRGFPVSLALQGVDVLVIEQYPSS